MNDDAPKLLRLEEVMQRTALGRSTIYDRVSRGLFPEPVRLGRKCTRWIDEDINAWIRRGSA